MRVQSSIFLHNHLSDYIFLSFTPQLSQTIKILVSQLLRTRCSGHQEPVRGTGGRSERLAKPDHPRGAFPGSGQPAPYLTPPPPPPPPQWAGPALTLWGAGRRGPRPHGKPVAASPRTVNPARAPAGPPARWPPGTPVLTASSQSSPRPLVDSAGRRGAGLRGADNPKLPTRQTGWALPWPSLRSERFLHLPTSEIPSREDSTSSPLIWKQGRGPELSSGLGPGSGDSEVSEADPAPARRIQANSGGWQGGLSCTGRQHFGMCIILFSFASALYRDYDITKNGVAIRSHYSFSSSLLSSVLPKEQKHWLPFNNPSENSPLHIMWRISNIIGVNV